MLWLAMVVIKNERQPMNLACTDTFDNRVSEYCSKFPNCECGYAEGRMPPNYPVPVVPVAVYFSSVSLHTTQYNHRGYSFYLTEPDDFVAWFG